MSYSRKATQTYLLFRYTILTLLLSWQTYAMGHSVGLDWTDNSDNEIGFLVERSINGEAFEIIGETSANDTTFRDETIETDTHYSYRVCAYNAFGTTDYTNVATHEIHDLPPSISIDFISSADSDSLFTGEPFLVSLDISDTEGVSYVDYYIDGQLEATATEAPFDGLLLIDQAGTANLKIVAYVHVSSEPVTLEQTIEIQDSKPSINALQNGSFDEGLSYWKFYTNGSGSAEIVESRNAVQISINSVGTNTQLFQSDIPLKPNTEYKVSFDAYSSTGHDLRLSLSKHSTPYTNYGLNREIVNLTTDWKTHTLTFTTKGFSSNVTDGRLAFWLANDARNGDRYYLDNIQIVEAGSEPETEPQPEPEPAPETPLPVTNALKNGTFNDGLTDWKFYTNGAGSANTTEVADSSTGAAAEVSIVSIGSNTQLFQSGIRLKPNTEYKLAFSASSNSGNNLRVSLSKHGTPYTNYGLNLERVDITSSWDVHTLTFTTRGFSSEISDGRLVFWFADDAKNGDRYLIDNVQLFEPNQEQEAEPDSGSDPDPATEPDNEKEEDPAPEQDPVIQPQPNSNVLKNGDFENDLSSWSFYTNGSGYAKTTFSSYNGTGNAALIALNSLGTNIQLLQSGVPLEPNTEYVLTFAAYSNSGRDLEVALTKHVSPYSNYGLKITSVDLTTEWKTFTVKFTTKNFTSSVKDGRLYFWFADDARAGDWYYIDQVNLSKAN
ncbi:carbohydrate binding domain-containing protein [Pelagicoccus mobilis]|uniref:Carbohydrate binding domain-containing protein n=1 Tax=Pelagicoccus mobilis TaxID=415221 RepID=A0A934RZJ1_9BACT|nr:carbohydrate binding domain-containing protein [Pelagicoccus mobilis]MBK1879617.1 carbohydrate binding domain-containing protein [Pelagicoccus mobilis]